MQHGTLVDLDNDGRLDLVGLELQVKRYHFNYDPDTRSVETTSSVFYDDYRVPNWGWVGPDWLGRWYRRNVRMLANLVKMNQPEERILILVGDNHKWTLDAQDVAAIRL